MAGLVHLWNRKVKKQKRSYEDTKKRSYEETKLRRYTEAKINRSEVTKKRLNLQRNNFAYEEAKLLRSVLRRCVALVKRSCVDIEKRNYEEANLKHKSEIVNKRSYNAKVRSYNAKKPSSFAYSHSNFAFCIVSWIWYAKKGRCDVSKRTLYSK